MFGIIYGIKVKFYSKAHDPTGSSFDDDYKEYCLFVDITTLKLPFGLGVRPKTSFDWIKARLPCM
jgi:hypothetical protein